MKAKLGWYTFDVSPTNMSWGYSMLTKRFDTYGGRVVQLLSCKVDDITLKGYVPCCGQDSQYENMEAMERQIRELMEWQTANKKPVQFSFPALGWSGDVHVLNYGEVSYSYDLVAATYTITMSVVNGFGELVSTIAADAMRTLQNVPDGVNWRYSKYNTPKESDWQVSLDALKAILEDSGNYGTVKLQDYYEQVFKLLDEKNEQKEAEQGSSGSSEEKRGGIGGLIADGVSEMVKPKGGIMSLIGDWMDGVMNG